MVFKTGPGALDQTNAVVRFPPQKRTYTQGPPAALEPSRNLTRETAFRPELALDKLRNRASRAPLSSKNLLSKRLHQSPRLPADSPVRDGRQHNSAGQLRFA